MMMGWVGLGHDGYSLKNGTTSTIHSHQGLEVKHMTQHMTNIIVWVAVDNYQKRSSPNVPHRHL